MTENWIKLGYFCTSSTSLDCFKCRTIQTIDGEPDDVLEIFDEKGWRATEKNCYCPKCAKKYLKKKK
jgi:hypothetical protein